MAGIANHARDPRSCSRTRLPSTSSPSASTASVPSRPADIHSAASSPNPPRKTPRRSSSSRWSSPSSRVLHSMVACMVRWRSGRSRAPPASSVSAWSSRSTIASGVRTLARAAASSSASGAPSSAAQIASTDAAFSSVTAKSGLTARARSTNRSAATAAGSGPRSTLCSPPIRSRIRLVASTETEVAPSSALSAGAASTTCSTLSRTSSMRRSPSAITTFSASGGSPVSLIPSACAIAGITWSGSSTGARSTNAMPSGNAASTARAAATASRLFPMPPGPVIVTSRCSSSMSIRVTASSSSSRPSSRVSGDGSPITSVEVTGAAASGRSAPRGPAASNRSARRVARSAVSSSASSSASVNDTYDAASSSRMRASRSSSRGCRSVAGLDVDQLRDVGGERPLVLEARHLLTRRDPPVLLPVHADEDVALLEVGPVQRTRRIRARAELEHHRGEGEPLDRGAGGATLGRQFLAASS